MRHVKQKKGKDRVAATIVLCFCLIALTSIFTIQASIDKVNEKAKNLAVDQQIATAGEEAAVPDTKEKKTDHKEAADLPVAKEIPIVDSADSREETSEKAANFLPPVNLATAGILNPYSMDMIIYNKTLDQYMTHPGIDLEAPAGSSVNAIADGTVTDVYEDSAYGTTIEITHDTGLISKYASLESAAMVEKGDTVKQGQQIGAIGMTALYESMEPAHLHFELYEKDRLCNPADYIAFE